MKAPVIIMKSALGMEPGNAGADKTVKKVKPGSKEYWESLGYRRDKTGPHGRGLGPGGGKGCK